MVLVLVPLIALLTLGAPEAERDPLPGLERELRERPDDVDLMVQLAHAYARGGDRTRARAMATEVLRRAPEYWDAHILLARLDAWEGRYEPAMDRLEAVLKGAPLLQAALHLKVDVEFWAGQLVDARETLQELLARAETAELHYRLAQVEYERMHYWAAWEAASRALELDPIHKGARTLKEEITLVRAEFVVEVEHLPVAGNQFAEAQIVSVTLLPSAFLSLSVVEELRYRFGSWNQFLLGQIDYRLHRRLRVGGFAGFGAPAPAISRSAASVWIGAELAEPLDARLSYRYDRVGLPGDLHRIALDAGLRLPFSFRAELGYTLGLVSAEEPGLADLHGLRARIAFEPGPFAAHFDYAFGSQVDRPVVVLAELDTHDLALGFRYATRRWLELLAGFGLQFRRSMTSSGEAVRGSFGARLSF